ncbi:hypothetical protein [Longirhabdus pacifica]|uniref:hypothetical protein n=1 Tax=Longirhabdus pacifica TaxID=2305227 RepID=UPI001008DD0F|nr:hypothetical protein [Longirhabdus pacifica]
MNMHTDNDSAIMYQSFELRMIKILGVLGVHTVFILSIYVFADMELLESVKTFYSYLLVTIVEWFSNFGTSSFLYSILMGLYIIILILFYIPTILNLVRDLFSRTPILIIEKDTIKVPIPYMIRPYHIKISTFYWKTFLMYIFPYKRSLYFCSLDKNKQCIFKQYEDETKKYLTLVQHSDANLAFYSRTKFKQRLRQFLNDHGIQGELVELEKAKKSDIEKNKKNKLIETICIMVSFILFLIMMKDNPIFLDAFRTHVQPNKLQGLFLITSMSGGLSLARLIFSVKDARYLYKKLQHKEKIESNHIKQFLINVSSAIGFGVLYSILLYMLMF